MGSHLRCFVLRRPRQPPPMKVRACLSSKEGILTSDKSQDTSGRIENGRETDSAPWASRWPRAGSKESYSSSETLPPSCHLLRKHVFASGNTLPSLSSLPYHIDHDRYPDGATAVPKAYHNIPSPLSKSAPSPTFCPPTSRSSTPRRPSPSPNSWSGGTTSRKRSSRMA